jgi:hypothetical protein
MMKDTEKHRGIGRKEVGRGKGVEMTRESVTKVSVTAKTSPGR